MQNETRDWLVRRLNDWGTVEAEALADFLLTNGVIVPPCKIDDTLYYIPFGKNIEGCIVHSIEIIKTEIVIKCHMWRNEREGLLHKHLVYFYLDDFGKTVFLTKEEAEKALKEGADNG